MKHLQQVIQQLTEAGLKLKPSECSFLRKEVEYLGHIIMPQGSKLVAAVCDFPPLRNLQDVR